MDGWRYSCWQKPFPRCAKNQTPSLELALCSVSTSNNNRAAVYKTLDFVSLQMTRSWLAECSGCFPRKPPWRSPSFASMGSRQSRKISFMSSFSLNHLLDSWDRTATLSKENDPISTAGATLSPRYDEVSGWPSFNLETYPIPIAMVSQKKSQLPSKDNPIYSSVISVDDCSINPILSRNHEVVAIFPNHSLVSPDPRGDV